MSFFSSYRLRLVGVLVSGALVVSACESTGTSGTHVGVYYDSMLWNDYYHDRPDRPDRPKPPKPVHPIEPPRPKPPRPVHPIAPKPPISRPAPRPSRPSPRR